MFDQEFMRNAFLAGTFVALNAGLVGYFVVLRNQVFMGDAQSHVAFMGAAAALAFGIDPLLGLFSATVGGSVLMGELGGSARERDVAVGVTFAWVMGLGVLFLSLYTAAHSGTNGAAGVHVLFGSIFGISASRAAIAAVVGGVTSLVLLLMGRRLLFVSVDPAVATARGLPVRALGAAFMVILGISVGEAVQVVGALLFLGLFVTPAATAQLITARPYLALALSAVFSVAAMWGGLTLSHVFQTVPPSFLIIAIAFVIYLGALIASGLTARRQRRDTQERNASDMVAA